MAVDIFGTEVRPGDLIVSSGAGNGYMSVNCVIRVMPKSVEHTGYPSKSTNKKMIVIDEEKAIKFFGDTQHRTILKSRELKEKFNID